jgi:hypothetical protein
MAEEARWAHQHGYDEAALIPSTQYNADGISPTQGSFMQNSGDYDDAEEVRYRPDQSRRYYQ